MSKYKLKIILENEAGEVVNKREKEIKVRDNNFSGVELEIFRLRKEIIPELEENIFELEQKEYKKNKRI